MSEPWLGLHNPERHTTFASSGGVATCSRETGWCTPERPCGCCMDEEARRLAAEVEALRAQRDSLANKLVNEIPGSYVEIKARALKAEAQIAAVREAVERHERIYAPSDAEGIPVQVILRALGGDGDE